MRHNNPPSAKLYKKIFQPLLLLILTLLSTQFWPKIFSYFGMTITINFAHIINYTLACFAWLFAAWIINGLIEVIFWDNLLEKRLKISVPSLIKDMVKVIIYFLIILAVSTNVFGTSINGFLAASGLIGLIVGLAVKNLIADLFNGLALNFDRPFDRGELITLQAGGGVPGVLKVLDTTWRTTRFETEGNDLLVVPNSKLGSMVITNLSKNSQGSFNLTVQVEAAVPTRRALRILEAAVKSAEGVLSTPSPQVVINAIKNNAVVYKIAYWLAPSKIQPSQVKHHISSNILHLFNLAGFSLNNETFSHIEEIKGHLGQPVTSEFFLSHVELFKNVSDADREMFAEILVTRHYSKGSTIVELGASGDSLFMVVEGLLNVYIHPTNEASFLLVGHLSSGEFFGEMSLLAGEPRSARIVAETDVILYEITKDSIAPLLETNPELIENFGRVIAERETRNQEKQLEALSLAERQAHYESIFQKIIRKIKRFFGFKT